MPFPMRGLQRSPGEAARWGLQGQHPGTALAQGAVPPLQTSRWHLSLAYPLEKNCKDSY